MSISYKYIELQCLADYFSIEKKYPDWNLQENNEAWNKEITDLEIITKQLKNKNKKGVSFREELIKKGHKNTKIKR